jgi:hypothetical protein
MEAHIVHGPSVPRELVQKLTRPRLPDRYTLVSTASCDLLTLRIPACFQEVAFLTGRCPVICLDAPICGCERPNVPRPDSRVMCI